MSRRPYLAVLIAALGMIAPVVAAGEIVCGEEFVTIPALPGAGNAGQGIQTTDDPPTSVTVRKDALIALHWYPRSLALTIQGIDTPTLLGSNREVFLDLVDCLD